MNYFAHGCRFVDDAYFLAGTALPDWLSVVNRRARVRSKLVAPHGESADPRTASLARGMLQHLHDDAWFHATPAFYELNAQLTAMVRSVLTPDDSLRPSFLGHILVEILLDAALIARQPELLDRYYQALEQVDSSAVQAAVNSMLVHPVERLDWFIGRFRDERFLCDYADDAKLWFRLNQVMRRVQLPPLPESLLEVLPQCRDRVSQRVDQLLDESFGATHEIRL